MTRLGGCRLVAAACVLLGAARAGAGPLPAPENDVPPPPADTPEDSRLVPPPEPPAKLPPSVIGVQATLGGGVTGFLERSTRSYLRPGAAWNLRVALGTRWPLVVEASYVGSVQGIVNLGLDSGAVLVGSGAEGALRFNPMQGRLQPYVLAGAGWTHYSIVNTQVRNADVAAANNVFVMPIGGGATMRVVRGLVVDVRGTIRLTFDNQLLPGTASSTALHSWGLAASAGWEF